MATAVATLGVREALEQIAEEQKQERREKRNRKDEARAAATTEWRQLVLPLPEVLRSWESGNEYKARLISDHHFLQMDYRISEWARWIRLGYSAARLAAHVPPGSHAELYEDAVVLIAFLQELLRLIDDPRQMSIRLLDHHRARGVVSPIAFANERNAKPVP